MRHHLTALFLVSLLWAAPVAPATLPRVQPHAGAVIRAVTEVIAGHNVGGVTIDLVGTIYVADFGDIVWKMPLEGGRIEFATGLYGASGNAIDGRGNLLQSSYHANSITRIDRKGNATPFVTNGLSGPVGLAVDTQTGDIFVANCRGNFIARATADGSVSSFARSDLFNCPNGLTFDRDGNLYVVNFRDNRMLKIDAKGAVAPFATVSEKGLGHVCVKDDRFYVTASQSHAIYAVTRAGVATRILGNGERGMVDGEGNTARLSFPNGIACHPWARRLYVNELASASELSLPPRAIVREILLDGDNDK